MGEECGGIRYEFVRWGACVCVCVEVGEGYVWVDEGRIGGLRVGLDDRGVGGDLT